MKIKMSRVLVSAIIALTLLNSPLLEAQEFRITEAGLSSEGGFILSFPSSVDYYYILKRGSDPESIISSRAVTLGTGGAGHLEDGLAST